MQRILRILDLSDAELSILLTGDEEIAELNGLFRHKPYSTDVLSFPQEVVVSLPDGFERPRVLGDLVLSLETVARQATKGAYLVLRQHANPLRYPHGPFLMKQAFS